MQFPPSIEALNNLLQGLPGVTNVDAKHTPLEDMDPSLLTLVPFGDLPHAVLLRTNGGLRGEALGQFFVDLRPDLESWRTLEFLSWQVRDFSRSGRRVQIRSSGLPPFIDGRIQLGTSLKFILEFFVDGLETNPDGLLKEIADFGNGLKGSLECFRLSWAGGEVIREQA